MFVFEKSPPQEPGDVRLTEDFGYYASKVGAFVAGNLVGRISLHTAEPPAAAYEIATEAIARFYGPDDRSMAIQMAMMGAIEAIPTELDEAPVELRQGVEA